MAGDTYRQGEDEHLLDEVWGGDGSQDPLDAVLLLLHVCLLVELGTEWVVYCIGCFRLFILHVSRSALALFICLLNEAL